ncbi:Na-translocating system protein MpsC family protein [Sinobaca sp. H24]|uniref:Na-translocating system protein MpsC family protein n=1 Tax=Sinobaca sp. H24 TaxID=2923376 RepID=UPI0020794583|nr:Na-translocating system protein MpsC family protein [Sinobaca sp. H24]
MIIKEQQQQIASFTGRLLRDTFGKGPQASYALLGESHAIIFLREFFSPMERSLMQAEGEEAVHSLRESMMKEISPEVRRYIESITGEVYNEFFFDWNLSDHSGVLIGLKPEAFESADQMNESLQQQYEYKREVEEKVADLSEEAERRPDRVASVRIDKRTILIVREGILVAIEKKLIEMGHGYALKTAKRIVEKELFYRQDVFSSILHVNVQNIYVDWDFIYDKSTIVIVTDAD